MQGNWLSDMHYSTPFLLCSQMAGGHPLLRTEKKNLENPVMTSTGNLSSQARQIRNVFNAILEQWNGLAEKIKQKLRYIHAFTTATISSSGGKVNYLIW